MIPKEEFPKFIERLEAAFEKIDSKKEDKKLYELEIRGTNEELDGFVLEIFTFDQARYDEFLDVTQDYIKNTIYYASLNLNVKEGSEVEKLKDTYKKSNSMFSCIPIFKDKYELKFRTKEKQVSFDVIAKEGKGKIIQDLL